MSTAVDTRKYTNSRLPSNYGYQDYPVVDDTLPSRLPWLTQRTGRLIQIGRRICEIWSPNSAVHPYLPGIIPKGFNFSIPDNPNHRRYDGHLGRFDYTVVPQMFSDERPWRGFIRRPFSLQASNYPEFAVIHQIWKPLPSSPDDWPTRLPQWYIKALDDRVAQLRSASRGNDEIAPHRPPVWKNRPELPSPTEIDGLAAIENFDTAVDLVLEMQRRIRDFDAWHRYVQHCLNDYPEGHAEDWLRNPQPPANDEWLGAWVNGAVENEVLCALYWRMPCFIAHMLSDEERSEIGRRDVPTTSFTERTDITALDVLGNGYDFIARRCLQRPTLHAPMQRAELPHLHAKYRTLSASTAHGWSGRWYSEVVDSQQLLKLRPPPPLPPLPGQDYAPLIPAPEALPLDTVVVDKERVPWIRPPPVMKFPAAGKLSHWIEGTVDGKDGMVEVAKSTSLHTLTWVIDRELKRKLYFSDELRPPPGAVSNNRVFGFPPPPLLFLDRSRRQVVRSKWVYHDEQPSPIDIGCFADTPVPSSLPLLTDISAFPSMRPDGGDDDDDNYIPEADDMYYILPKYPKRMLQAPPTTSYSQSNIPPSLQVKAVEPMSTEAPKAVKECLLANEPTSVPTFIEKFPGLPAEDPELATDPGLFQAAEVESTLGQNLVRNGVPRPTHESTLPEQFPLVEEAVAVKESTSTKSTTRLDEAGGILVVDEASSSSSLPGNEAEHTTQAPVPATGSEPETETTPVQAFVLARDGREVSVAARDGALPVEDRGSVIVAVEEPSLPSLAANEAETTLLQAPVLAKDRGDRSMIFTSEALSVKDSGLAIDLKAVGDSNLPSWLPENEVEPVSAPIPTPVTATGEPTLVWRLPSLSEFGPTGKLLPVKEPTPAKEEPKDSTPPTGDGRSTAAFEWAGTPKPVSEASGDVEVTPDETSLFKEIVPTDFRSGVTMNEPATMEMPQLVEESTAVRMKQPTLTKPPLPTLFSPTMHRIYPLHDETSVSLGSSPQSTIDEASEVFSPATKDLSLSSADRNSTYLCVSFFRSSDIWRAFLKDLRGFASQKNIRVLEVLRLFEQKGVHFAWISLANESDTLCTRGYYTGTTFHGSVLDVRLVDEVAYFAAVPTAVESWCARDTPTVPAPLSREPLTKRGRSLTPRSLSPDLERHSWGEDSWTLSQASRGVSPPQNKRRRVGDHSNHQSFLHLGHNTSDDELVFMDNRRRFPERAHRPPPARLKSYRCPPPLRYDRSLPPGSQPKAYYHASSPLRHDRSPPPTLNQGFHSSGFHYGHSPRRYHSPSPACRLPQSRSYHCNREITPSPACSPPRSSNHRRSHSPRYFSPSPARRLPQSRNYRRSPIPRHFTHSPTHSLPRLNHRHSPSPRHFARSATRGSSQSRNYHRSSSSRNFTPSPIRNPPQLRHRSRSPSPRHFGPPLTLSRVSPPRSRNHRHSHSPGNHFDHSPARGQHSGSRDYHHDHHPHHQHYHGRPSLINAGGQDHYHPTYSAGPSLHSCLSGTSSDPQTMPVFGSYPTHDNSSSYQFASRQYQPPLVLRQLSSLTLQPSPPIVPPIPNPSRGSLVGRLTANAKPRGPMASDVPLSSRIGKVARSKTRRAKKRGKRGGAGRNQPDKGENQTDKDEDQTDQDEDQPDWDG